MERCFGRTVNIEDTAGRSHMRQWDLRDGIARYVANAIARLTVERRSVEFENAVHKLSLTRPFSWRRNLPPLACRRTIFNYVATYNDYERRFAEFLDKARDIRRFASLGTTQQGDSNTQFRVDYLKPSGAIGFYHPDWVAVQKADEGDINWIIETKGRVWEGTESKDEAIADWCARVSEQTGSRWHYVRVNQTVFGNGSFSSFAALIEKSRPVKSSSLALDG